MGIQRYIGTKKAALNKDIGELQKSIAEAAIEKIGRSGIQRTEYSPQNDTGL